MNDRWCYVIDWRARCVATSVAEVWCAEADRSDARGNGRMTFTDASFAGRLSLACCVRTRHAATRAAFASLFELGCLLRKDRIDVRVRRVGHETQAVVFCLNQFLADFCAGLLLRGCVRSDCR